MRNLLFLFLIAGCAEDLADPDPGPDAGVETGPTENGDGTFSLVVDATDEAAFVHLDFDEGVVGEGADLALRRYVVALEAGALAVFVPDATFDGAQAPETGWRGDLPDGDDEGEEPDRVFDTWYDYDPATHVLTPKAGLWFVRSPDGTRHHAVRMDGYYDAAGTAGHLGLSWKAVDGPTVIRPPATTLEVAAPEGFVYLDLREGRIVEVADPATENTWDIGIYGVRVRTNGGTSGAGEGGAYEVAVDEATGDPTRCEVDTELPEPGPPGAGVFSGNPVLSAWYDYDPMRHVVSPRRTAFVVCLADGSLARLRITTYADDVMTVEYTLADGTAL